MRMPSYMRGITLKTNHFQVSPSQDWTSAEMLFGQWGIARRNTSYTKGTGGHFWSGSLRAETPLNLWVVRERDISLTAWFGPGGEAYRQDRGRGFSGDAMRPLGALHGRLP